MSFQAVLRPCPGHSWLIPRCPGQGIGWVSFLSGQDNHPGARASNTSSSQQSLPRPLPAPALTPCALAHLQQFMLISDLFPDKCLFLFLNCILFFKKPSPIIHRLCLKTPDLPLGLGQGSYPRTWELVRGLSCPELFRSHTHIPRASASPRKRRHVNVSMARLGTFFGWTLRFLFLVQSL